MNISKEFAKDPNVENPIDLSIILNRLYLDHYKSYSQFWDDINLLFNQIEIYYEERDIDIVLLARRLKRIAIYAYKNWYSFSSEMFEKIKKINIKGNVLVILII